MTSVKKCWLEAIGGAEIGSYAPYAHTELNRSFNIILLWSAFAHRKITNKSLVFTAQEYSRLYKAKCVTKFYFMG